MKDVNYTVLLSYGYLGGTQVGDCFTYYASTDEGVEGAVKQAREALYDPHAEVDQSYIASMPVVAVFEGHHSHLE